MSYSGVPFSMALLAVLVFASADEPRAKLSRELRRISKLQTSPLTVRGTPTEQEIGRMEVKDLQLEIKEAYVRVQCSYALIALRHLRLTAGVLTFPRHLSAKMLFDEEAAAMLDTAINVPGLVGVKYTMWAFWLFANRVRRILEAGNRINYPAFASIHRAVDSLLVRFLNDNPCTCCNLSDQLSYLKVLQTQVLKKRYQVDKEVAKHRGSLAKQFDFNRAYGVSTGGRPRISAQSSTINGLLAFGTMVRKYLGTVYWDKIETGVGRLYDNAMNLGVRLSTQVDYLYAYQQEFMITLRVAFLMTIRQYLIERAAGRHRAPIVVLGRNVEAARAMLRFADRTAKPNDRVLRSLINRVPDRRYNDIAAWTKYVDHEITCAMGLSKIEALKKRDFRLLGRDGPALFGIIEFVKYLDQTILANVDMGSVNSITLYAFSDQYRRVRTEETKHQEAVSSDVC